MAKYSVGIDFGTNSVRAVVVDCADGTEVGTGVCGYPGGKLGIFLDERDPNVARESPDDYLVSMAAAVSEAVRAAGGDKIASSVVGIGVDATGSTPAPLDQTGTPLSMLPKFKGQYDAMFWLWKDHTAHAEAVEITELAAKEHPEYLERCGNAYSAEWFWSKILHCARVNSEVFAAAHTWAELSDWIPGVLIGCTSAAEMPRSRCAAGHKAMFSDDWGGLPDAAFLNKLDPRLGELRARLYSSTVCAGTKIGGLCKEWAGKFGLPEGTPVSAGIMDAHAGAVGSGVAPGRFVKIVGTSTCDIAVAPRAEGQPVPRIPGICGVVDGSVLPGMLGLEAGQSAVGDIFSWYVNTLSPVDRGALFEELSKGAQQSGPGESGLLALDWWNGNRTVLVDQCLTGLLLGQTLSTTPAEMFRALVEATAFGANAIIKRFSDYKVEFDDVVLCGGIAEKNPLVVQIYADVIGKEMKLARSGQTCALGSAIAGAVAGGAHATFGPAVSSMAGLKTLSYKPNAEAHKVYAELFELYLAVHDAFGKKDATPQSLFHVMKKLIEIRDRQRKLK